MIEEQNIQQSLPAETKAKKGYKKQNPDGSRRIGKYLN